MTVKNFVLQEQIAEGEWAELGVYPQWVEAKFRYWQATEEEGKISVRLLVKTTYMNGKVAWKVAKAGKKWTDVIKAREWDARLNELRATRLTTEKCKQE